MMIEIIKHTPPWVFALFVVLLGLGWYQGRARTVRRSRMVVFPLVMILLSCYGVISAFGRSPLGIGCWLLGGITAVVLALKLAPTLNAAKPMGNGLILIPSSWLPMALIMTLFVTKYAVGVCLARQLPIISLPLFFGSVSFVYGLLGGFFFGRALSIRSVYPC